MTNNMEQKYNELSKKRKLPEFKELDHEFEISDLEETNFLIRSIIRRIAEKLDFYTTMLEEVLQPDTSNLYAMHEIRLLEEHEKSSMYDSYKKLMHLNRKSIEVSLELEEKSQLEFIIEAFTEWKIIKIELLEYVKKM